MRGIGRAVAVALAELGADLIVTGTGRDPQNYPADEKEIGWRDIESTAEQIRSHGSSAVTVIANAQKSADAERTVNAALSKFGRVDIVINNAAVERGGDRVPIHQLSEDAWRKVLDVKLTGSFLLSKAAVPPMLERDEGGSIVNISSVMGKRGAANTTAYCAANFGLQGFTQALAMELAPHNIRVNAVCPGLIDTARMDSLGRGDEWDKLQRSMIPLQRAAKPEEVAGLIAWLCTPAASYMTGQSINFDGGIVMW